MASFNQNIVRHEHDGDFDLVFTVSNSGTSLSSTNFCAVWLMLNTSTVTASSTILIYAGGPNQNTADKYNVTADASNCNSTATKLSTETRDINIGAFTNQITIPFTYSTMQPINDGSYYHELILLKRSSDVCFQCQSQVVATGLMTVNESLFTNEGYR